MLGGRIISRQAVGDEGIIYRIKPDASVPSFKPGQHISIGCDEDGVQVVRPYSIASSPEEAALELYIQDKLSDSVRIAEHAAGKLTLDDVPFGRDLLMIATGTGIAPFVSMLRAFKAQQRWRTFTLVHGVRNVRDLAYRRELEASDARYIPVVSREKWDGAIGRVQSVLELQTRDREQTHAFICGGETMVAEVEQMLHAHGFAHVHLERYK